MQENEEREKSIVRTSLVGIGANLFLVVFKITAGLLADSIAVILDGVNNLSDALSSLITIVGVKLAQKRPDAKHPLGYGRIEYLSAMLVSGIVLYAGITSLIESVKKIIHPSAADYTAFTMVILAASIAVKLVLSAYVQKQGKKVNSAALTASGKDAGFDAVLSLSVLASALLYLFADISIEAYVGVLIAAIIIRSGWEMLRDTLDDILGSSFDRELVHNIKETVKGSDPRIKGAYDLILHSYGPSHTIGSIHIAVRDDMTAEEIDALSRKTAGIVYEKYNVVLAGIGIYSSNTKNDEASAIRSRVTDIVMKHDGVLQMHGFFIDALKKYMSFDIILDWNIKDRDALYTEILNEVKAAYPDWNVHSTLDLDI